MIVNCRPGPSKTLSKNICTLTPVGPDQASLLPPTQYEPQLDPSWESIRGRSGGVIYSTITTPVARHPKKDTLELIILNTAILQEVEIGLFKLVA